METSIEPVPSSLRLTDTGVVGGFCALPSGDRFRRVSMRLIANGFDDEPRRVHGACRRRPVRGGRWPPARRSMPSRVYPDGAQRHARHRARSAGGREFGRCSGFSARRWIRPRCRVEGEAGAKLTIGAIDAKPPRAAPPVNSARTRQAHRGAEGRARQSAGRDRCGHRAAQIRRALCGYFSGRDRRQG